MTRLARLVAFAIGLAMLRVPRVEGQVSPGPLTRTHRDLEGALKCTQCHGAGKDAMTARCAACHRDVGWLVARNRGFHGAAATKASPCAACHPDHAGADFQLIKWPDGSRDRFDHRRAGWALEQSHGKLECEKCHVAKFRTSPAAALASGGQSSWTGLETSCAGCHEDVHRGALDQRCTSCHDAGKWKRTPGFDHDTTDYALAGKHLEVKCDQCHASPRLAPKVDTRGNLVPVYRPVPHQTCGACHRDVHNGSFGANCSACHTVQGFRQISVSGGFDHGRISFPLRGKHAAVKCAACHQDFTTDRGRRPPSSTCATCHTPDPHGGSATLRGKPEDCASCHSENGFSPSTFSVERHQASRYPLEGKHLSARCSACHRKDLSPVAAIRLGSSRVMIRPEANRCLSCHRDDHGGQLAARPDRGDCATCHRPAGWKPSEFDRAAHAKLRLALDGRHAEISCRACHADPRKGLRPLPQGVPLGKAGFAFNSVEHDCVACHRDPHAGRFEQKGARPAAQGCATCHDPRWFLPATVDVAIHQRFSFPLLGAHRATPCAACHQEFKVPPPAKSPAALVGETGPLRPSSFQSKSACAECHQTVHGKQFDTRKDGGRCDACHGDDAFAPAARFDHDRDSEFKLDRGHQKVACEACHRPRPSSAGEPRIVYRPLSGKCESCHAKG